MKGGLLSSCMIVGGGALCEQYGTLHVFGEPSIDHKLFYSSVIGHPNKKPEFAETPIPFMGLQKV